MDLRGRVAFVTGGSGGIGSATCIAFAEAGADVVLTFHGDREGALAVVRRVTKLQRRVHAFRCDVSKFAAARDTWQAAVKEFGGVDVLVNNAGVLRYSKLDELTEGLWDHTLAVNLKGVYNMTKAAWPTLKERKGCVVNVASIAAQMGGRVGVHYAASKAGVIGFTKSLAMEGAPFGVRVNAVAPDAVDTKLLDAEMKKRIREASPLGEILQPDEVAKAILFLATQDRMTGQVLSLNTGRYLAGSP